MGMFPLGNFVGQDTSQEKEFHYKSLIRLTFYFREVRDFGRVSYAFAILKHLCAPLI